MTDKPIVDLSNPTAEDREIVQRMADYRKAVHQKPTTADKRKKPRPKAAQPAPPARKPAEQHDNRPYVLDSAVATNEIERMGENAASEIEAIEADMLSIEQRAQRDIASIRERADAEIKARTDRRADLQKIVDMVERASPRQTAPTRNVDTLGAVGAAIDSTGGAQ